MLPVWVQCGGRGWEWREAGVGGGGGAANLSNHIHQEMAALNSELPDTAFTLLDSCIWSVDTGYWSNYVVSVS